MGQDPFPYQRHTVDFDLCPRRRWLDGDIAILILHKRMLFLNTVFNTRNYKGKRAMNLHECFALQRLLHKIIAHHVFL